MVSFFKKKPNNRSSISLGNGGKSSSSPSLITNQNSGATQGNEYILYSSTELPNYDQFQNNHRHSKNINISSPSHSGANSSNDKSTSSGSGGGHSFGGGSFGNDYTNHPVTPPSPIHHHHLNHQNGNSFSNGGSNNNSFSMKSLNSNGGSTSSNSKKHDKNSVGSAGSNYQNGNSSPHPSSYSEKDVFPNGVKRALKGIMLMGEGNEDVVKRARTFISTNGDIHFTQEDLPQYMLPEDYEEDIYQPLQLKLPFIKPLSTHGFDSDSEDDSKNEDKEDDDDLYFDEVQKRSNWANGLSNWTPKSPEQVSQPFSKDSPLVNLRHLIYEEDKAPSDDEDEDNRFAISKEEVDKLFLNENFEEQQEEDYEEDEEDQFNNIPNDDDNSSDVSNSTLDYNIEDVDVEITKDDIRTSDPILINNNNNNSTNNSNNNSINKSPIPLTSSRKDQEILSALNSTIKLSSNLSSNSIIINNINNNSGNTLVSKLPSFTRNSSYRSINNSSPSLYNVSSKLPSQVSTISKSILKDLDSSDNDILQSLEMVIDSPRAASSNTNSKVLEASTFLNEELEKLQTEQQSKTQSPLKLNRDSGKIDILGGFEDILHQSFKNARKSILFEKKIIGNTTPNSSSNNLNTLLTSPPPPLIIESIATDLNIEQSNDNIDLQSSYSGLEKLRIDIQNLDISSNIATFDSDSKSNLDFSSDYYPGIPPSNSKTFINNSISFNNIDELENEVDDDSSLSDITHDNSSTFSSNDDNLEVLTGNKTTNLSDSSSENEETIDELESDQIDEQSNINLIQNSNENDNNNDNNNENSNFNDDIQNILNSIPNILVNNDENCIYFKENENPYDIYSPPSSIDDFDYDNYSHISSVRGIPKKDSLLSINNSIGRTLSNISSNFSDNNNNLNNNSNNVLSGKSSFNSSLSELSELLISLERKKPTPSSPIKEKVNQDDSNDQEEEFELKINKKNLKK